MKWISGLTYAGEQSFLENWYLWFAWVPVTVSVTPDNHVVTAWLEHVERKGTFHERGGYSCWTYVYRERKQEEVVHE